MKEKSKKTLSKKIFIGIGIAFIALIILSQLFPIDYYKTGIDNYNKQNFKEALKDFNNVEQSDKNYNDAISKIKEIKPIVDSLIKVEEIEKEKKNLEKIAKKEEKDKLKKANKEINNETNNSTSETKKDNGLKGVIGQSYDVGSLTYKVERVKFKKFIGGLYTLNKADGVFVIVSLTVTNKSHKEIIIDNSFFKLIDESGAEYGYSPDGTASLELSDFPGKTFLGMSLNPNVSKKGKVVFEVPTKKKAYKLIFTDPFTGTFLELEMNE